MFEEGYTCLKIPCPMCGGKNKLDASHDVQETAYINIITGKRSRAMLDAQWLCGISDNAPGYALLGVITHLVEFELYILILWLNMPVAVVRQLHRWPEVCF